MIRITTGGWRRTDGLLVVFRNEWRLHRRRKTAALPEIEDLGADMFELALIIVDVPDEKEHEQGEEMIIHHEALRQVQAAGFLKHVVVHFAPPYFARHRLVLVVCCDISQGLGQTRQDDVEVVVHDGHPRTVYLAAVSELPEELTGASNFFGQSHHVWMKGLGYGRAETVKTYAKESELGGLLGLRTETTRNERECESMYLMLLGRPFLLRESSHGGDGPAEASEMLQETPNPF